MRSGSSGSRCCSGRSTRPPTNGAASRAPCTTGSCRTWSRPRSRSPAPPNRPAPTAAPVRRPDSAPGGRDRAHQHRRSAVAAGGHLPAEPRSTAACRRLWRTSPADCAIAASRSSVETETSDLSPERQRLVYRVARECLGNVSRHSAATSADVRLAPAGLARSSSTSSTTAAVSMFRRSCRAPPRRTLRAAGPRRTSSPKRVRRCGWRALRDPERTGSYGSAYDDPHASDPGDAGRRPPAGPGRAGRAHRRRSGPRGGGRGGRRRGGRRAVAAASVRTSR